MVLMWILIGYLFNVCILITIAYIVIDYLFNICILIAAACIVIGYLLNVCIVMAACSTSRVDHDGEKLVHIWTLKYKRIEWIMMEKS